MGWWEPVGPLPPRVYWVRRGLVLVVGLLLLLLLVWLVRALFGGGSAGTAGATNGPSPAASPPPTKTAVASPTRTAAPTRTATSTSVATGAVVACGDAATTVLVTTDRASYPSGVQPKITLTVRNDGTVPCRRDVGAGALELLIRSGSARVWSSDDCGTSSGQKVVTLAPGKEVSETVVWPRSLSKPGCPSGQPAAQPGTYVVTGRAGSDRSAPVAFVLA